MDKSVTKITAKLQGIRPILFDRYAGDNNTKLRVEEKLYTDQNGKCVLPILNVFSLLTAQNTDSVANRFYGKQRRDIALGVNAFVAITPHNSETTEIIDVPILDDSGKQFAWGDRRIRVVEHVARMKKGAMAIPNPKQRPMLPTGWNITLDFYHTKNDLIQLPTIQKMIEQGGILGLGTFRPIFGRYTTIWI